MHKNQLLSDVTCRFVANETGFPYQTVYGYLEKLVDKGFILKEKSGRKNVYSVFKGKTPKKFIISEGKNEETPESLIKFVFSLFEGLPTLQRGTEVIIIDPITGEKVKVNLNENKELDVNVEEVQYQYPYEELREFERSKETISETEKDLKESFLPEIKDEKTVFPLEKEEALIEEVEYVDSLNDDALKKLKESVKAARLFNTTELEKKEKEE